MAGEQHLTLCHVNPRLAALSEWINDSLSRIKFSQPQIGILINSDGFTAAGLAHH